MIHAITRKLEIDVMQATELEEAIELAHKHAMPAIVVHPDLALEADVVRARRQARCAIYTPIDWPKGETRGIRKLQNMSISALSQNGFEIFLSPTKSASEAKQEILTLTNFIRDQLPEAVEIRLVLGATIRDRATIAMYCDILSQIPAPDIIRTDCSTRVQQTKANPQANSELVDFIREHTARPIKLSGNINSVKALACCKVNRYGVSLKQAQSIIKELSQQPEKMNKLLNER